MDVRDNSNPKLHIHTLHTVYCHELELARESGTPAAVENATDDVTVVFITVHHLVLLTPPVT